MSTLVMKFGGSLASDARSILQVAQIINAEALAWRRMVVVMSAMSGVTDGLAYAADLAARRDPSGYRKMIGLLRDQHLGVIEALFPTGGLRETLIKAVDRWLFNALAVCDTIAARHGEPLARDRDGVMSVGERMLTEILVTLVQREGLRCALVDSAQVVITDDRYQNANPLVDVVEERVERYIKPVLNEGMVALVSGFIGSTRSGHMTTLGRGGSDYTATMLGAALRADEVWMWTHVDGIMSADPSLVPGARVIDVLSYEEMRELSYFGVRLLHPRSIEPLLQRSIPLRVRNPFNLDHGGTLIQAEPSAFGLKAVSAIDGLLVSTQGFVELPDFMAQVNLLVGQAASGPVVVIQSQGRSTLVFVVPTSEGPFAVTSVVNRLTAGLPAERWQIQAVKVIAAIGGSQHLSISGGVKPIAFAQGPGSRSIFVVKPDELTTAVRQLHRLT